MYLYTYSHLVDCPSIILSKLNSLAIVCNCCWGGAFRAPVSVKCPGMHLSSYSVSRFAKLTDG